MPLAHLSSVLAEASAAGKGVGAFNVIQLEHAEAIVQGAEQYGAPVVLQISENTVDYHAGPAPLIASCLKLADVSAVPVVVHLDHVSRRELVEQGVELGVTSVMYDGSALEYAENVATTAAVVEWCHERGVPVEAELGVVGGKDGVHAPGARTDPAQAREFVNATGVDALAVAVGSSHAMLSRDAALDFDLISRLVQVVPVPLVLHGSSGVPDDGLRRAVESGMTKINIATQLNKVMTAAVREVLDGSPTVVDPRRYLGPARTAVRDEVARLLGVLRLERPAA